MGTKKMNVEGEMTLKSQGIDMDRSPLEDALGILRGMLAQFEGYPAGTKVKVTMEAETRV